MSDEGYKKYRGRCKELSEKLAKGNPNLRLVRGHYYCPQWGKQAHWWCEDKITGKIVDMTVDQFPEPHIGEYVEFNGICTCEQCGKEFPEEEAHINGNYACCSYRCAMKLVGL